MSTAEQPIGVDPRSDAAIPMAAALSALLALSLFMAVAALAGTVPSPPHDKLPFVATNIAMAVAALVVVRAGHGSAPWVAVLAALTYLPSVGPHKFLTEVHATALAPVIVVGSLSILVVWLSAVAMWWRASRAARQAGA